MSKTQIPTGGIADDAISEEHIDATVLTGHTALAATPADTDELLISDGGTIKRIDYSLVKGAQPFFRARNESTQDLSNGTDTIIHFQQDVFDPQGTFNNSSSSNTLNGISTDAFSFAPNVSGYYLLGASCHFQTVADGTSIEFKMRKNQSTIIRNMIHSGNASKDLNPHISILEVANGTSDDFQVSVRLDGSGENAYYDAAYVTFWGYRVV